MWASGGPAVCVDKASLARARALPRMESRNEGSESLLILDQEPTGTVHSSREGRERQVYALFGFLGILLLLAGLLPI